MSPDPATSAAAYQGVRTRVIELVTPLGEAVGDQPVAACPGWGVRELLSHLAGEAEDVAALNLDGVATPAWTAAQVERFRGRSVPEILAAWAAAGTQVDALLPHAPAGPASQLVFDVWTHEQDLRTTLGQQGARDVDAVEVALGFLLPAVGADIDQRGLPTLRVTVETGEVTEVGGPPSDGRGSVALTTTRFELLRAFGGRRSAAQVHALAWTGDPTPYLGLLTAGEVLHLRDVDLHEDEVA